MLNFFKTVKQQLLPQPTWLVDEFKNKQLLFLNHVLSRQDEVLKDRLALHAGKNIWLYWRDLSLGLHITPAGMFELAEQSDAIDLTLKITDTSAIKVLNSLDKNEKPDIYIEGNVALAKDVSAMLDNLRWDVEDDLANFIGDMPAYMVTLIGKRIVTALRTFVALLPQKNS